MEINHAAARPLFDDIIIVLSDNPVPRDMLPDSILSLSEENKMRGIMFSVSAKNSRLLGKGESIQSLHFYPVWEQLGIIGNGKLQIISFDDKTIKGRIYTPAENEWGGHTFSYDIEFSADISKVPVIVEIKGANDAPSRAFSAYYKGLMAGEPDKFKKYIADKRLQEIENDPDILEFFIEMQQAMNPTTVEIVSSIENKESALLNVIGTRGPDIAEGKIEMVKENNLWKVDHESWVSGELK